MIPLLLAVVLCVESSIGCGVESRHAAGVARSRSGAFAGDATAASPAASKVWPVRLANAAGVAPGQPIEVSTLRAVGVAPVNVQTAEPRSESERRAGAGSATVAQRQAGVDPRSPKRSVRVPLAIYSGAALADYGSTRYALSHGAREANPLVRDHLAGWKLAQVGVLVGVDVLLQRGGHKGKAKALRITAAVIGAGLAVHNVRVARRQR